MSAPLKELENIKGAKPAATVNRDELEAEDEHDWEKGLEKEKQEAWDAKPDQDRMEGKGEEKAGVRHVENSATGGQRAVVAAA
jgi:hypothetical protein